ncbi:MAG: asparagine synthase-related protein [Candidatus Thorarchaeota archaeon]
MLLITNFPTEGSTRVGSFYLKISDESQWLETYENQFLFKGSFWTDQEGFAIASTRSSNHSEMKDCLREINAIFSLIRITDQGKSLEFANDRYGFKSIFYYWNSQSDHFAVSDSYLSIEQELLSIGLQPNDVAISEFLLFNFPLDGKTFIKDLHRLQMGSIGFYSNGKLSIEQYWTSSSISSVVTDIEEAVQTIEDLLNKATSIIVSNHKDADFALGLSGGMDSRLVAAKFIEHGVKPICYVYGNRKADSFRVASEVAKQLDLKLVLVEIDPLFYENVCKDAIYVSPMINLLTSWPIASMESMPKYDVLLTGFNGDNMFGSHIRSESLSIPQGNIDSTIEQILAKYGQNGTIDEIQEIIIPSVAKQIRNNLQQFVVDSKSIDTWRIIEEFNFSNRQLAFIKSDFMFQSSASKWVSPFMYPPLVDYLNNIDISLRLDLRLFRKYMNAFYPELYRIRTERNPTATGTNILKKRFLKVIQLFERLIGTNYLTGETHKKFLLNLTHSREFNQYALAEFRSANVIFREMFDVDQIMQLLNTMTYSRTLIPRKVPSSQFRRLLRIFAALTMKFWFDSIS